MRWATDEGKLTSAAVAVVGAGAVLMEITILAGLAALGELSLEKLGAAMMIGSASRHHRPRGALAGDEPFQARRVHRR